MQAEYVDFEDSSRSRQILYFSRLSRIGTIEEPVLEFDSPIAPQEIAVSAELIVHGEHTDHYDGDSKTTPASFFLQLEIENRTHERQHVSQPTLHASVALPVSRWYLLGDDGEVWSGNPAKPVSSP